MDWELTDTPRGGCTACGNQPCDEKDPNRPPLPMIHAIGLDVNWGEELNLCNTCVGVICDLFGRPGEGELQKRDGQIKLLTKQRDKAVKELEEIKPLVEKIREGTKAQRELKKKAQEL